MGTTVLMVVLVTTPLTGEGNDTVQGQGGDDVVKGDAGEESLDSGSE